MKSRTARNYLALICSLEAATTTAQNKSLAVVPWDTENNAPFNPPNSPSACTCFKQPCIIWTKSSLHWKREKAVKYAYNEHDVVGKFHRSASMLQLFLPVTGRKQFSHTFPGFKDSAMIKPWRITQITKKL